MTLLSIDQLQSACEMSRSPWYHATDRCEEDLVPTTYNNTNAFQDIKGRSSPAMFRLICNGELLKEDYDSPSCSSDPNRVFKMHAEILDMRPMPLSPDESLEKLRKYIHPPVNTTTSMTPIQLVEARLIPLEHEVKSLVETVMKVDSKRQKTTIITDIHEFDMTIEMLNRILRNNWLNDMVINLSMKLIQERDRLLAGKNRVSVFQNTFFYSRLMLNNVYNYDEVKKWFKKYDVFRNVDKIFIPINCNNNTHWVLVVIFMELKEVCYFDSLQNGCGGKPYCDNILRFLDDHAKEKNIASFDVSIWKVVDYSKATPQQKNTSDCGVFVLTIVELLSVNLPISFSAIGRSRDQILLAILLGKLILPVGDNAQVHERHDVILKGGSSILLKSSAVEWLGTDTVLGFGSGASASIETSVKEQTVGGISHKKSSKVSDTKKQLLRGVSTSRHSLADIRGISNSQSPEKSFNPRVVHSPPGASESINILNSAFENELNIWLNDNVISNGLASTATMLKLAANDLFGAERNVSTSLDDSVYETLRHINGDERLTQSVWDSVIRAFDKRFADLSESDFDDDIIALESFLKDVRSTNWGQSPEKKRGNRVRKDNDMKFGANASIMNIAFENELNIWLNDNVISNGLASTATMLKLAANDLFGAERNVSTSLDDSVYETLRHINGDERLTQSVWDSVIRAFDKRFADLSESDFDDDIIALESFLKDVRSTNWERSSHDEQETQFCEVTDQTFASSLLPLSVQSMLPGDETEFQILKTNTECPTECYGSCRSDEFCTYLCGMNQTKLNDTLTVTGQHSWNQYIDIPTVKPKPNPIGFHSDLYVRVNCPQLCYVNTASTTTHPIYKEDGAIGVSIAVVKKQVLQTVTPYYKLLDKKRVSLLILSILRKVSGKFMFLTATYDMSIDGHWKIEQHDEKSTMNWKLDANCELDKRVGDQLRIQCHEAFEAVYRFSDNGKLGELDLDNELSIASLLSIAILQDMKSCNQPKINAVTFMHKLVVIK